MLEDAQWKLDAASLSIHFHSETSLSAHQGDFHFGTIKTGEGSFFPVCVRTWRPYNYQCNQPKRVAQKLIMHVTSIHSTSFGPLSQEKTWPKHEKIGIKHDQAYQARSSPMSPNIDTDTARSCADVFARFFCFCCECLFLPFCTSAFWTCSAQESETLLWNRTCQKIICAAMSNYKYWGRQ